jgi:hypothetical protein
MFVLRNTFYIMRVIFSDGMKSNSQILVHPLNVDVTEGTLYLFSLFTVLS